MQHKLGIRDNACSTSTSRMCGASSSNSQKMQARADTLEAAPAAPIGIPDSFDDHLTVTYDLLHLAFQGDISRVFTFMLGHEGSGRSYAHIGISEPHHPVSHHGDKPEGIERYAKLTTYQMVKFARVRRQAQVDAGR